MTWLTALITASLALAASDRTLVVKYAPIDPTKCPNCAAKMMAVLKNESGIIKTEPVVKQNAVLVFFTSGQADIHELKGKLKAAGVKTKIAWGPAAARVDGNYEQIPLEEIPVKRPTLKQIEEQSHPLAQPGVKLYKVPESETLPVQKKE